MANSTVYPNQSKQFMFIPFSTTATISDNSLNIEVNLSSFVPVDYSLVGFASINIGTYPLPYMAGSGTNSRFTSVSHIYSNGLIKIDNTASGWGSSTISGVMIVQHS